MGARALGSGPGQRVHWAWGLQNLGALARIPWRRSGVRVPALPLGRCVSLGKPRALCFLVHNGDDNNNSGCRPL